ncbi:formyltetrahydrofolate deformylase [Actinorhabdospora filicis]|uniref:Formyltetrahydrofolate deformylase n=1 Tax=Actinorhabdospora filicis TaxID=1785913 RepID=A0A9W6SGM4_9ACTN|nr:formyltetrahydrofolate deformylase [Actinorhabdospora filicis]GLZ75643.1 formyltetrahydrofolate deformylase [Actinorhabdospora filicis]
MSGEYILILSCPDRVGIVHAVAGFLAERGGNIKHSNQFSDPGSGRFFMRVQFTCDTSVAGLRVDFAAVGAAFGMEWELHDTTARQRVLVLVSKQDHCLNDLLYRFRTGAIPGELTAVVSNHPDARVLTDAAGVPFHHLPVTTGTKAEQEGRILELVEFYRADVVVLARYMQVLSDDFCAKLSGRIINIHHSFLPSFKGARPYHQAYDRGVKIIGATTHYVTADLDEGPIIEQEIARVDHAMSPSELVAVGRDLESLVLARGLTWHLEHRVVMNGGRTVVFR